MDALIRLALVGALIFGVGMGIRWLLSGISARVARAARASPASPAAQPMPQPVPQQIHRQMPGRRRILALNALAFVALLMPWRDGSLLALPLIFTFMLQWVYPLTCAWRERPMLAFAAQLSAVSALVAAVMAVVVIATQSQAGIGSSASAGALAYLLCAVAHVSGVSVYLRGQRAGDDTLPIDRP